MSEIYIGSVEPRYQNARACVELARHSLRAMSVSLAEYQRAIIKTESDMFVHLFNNNDYISAAYDGDNDRMLSVAEFGSINVDRINPIDKRLGRLSVHMANQPEYIGVQLISGLYTNPNNDRSRAATGLLINEFIQNTMDDTYVAVDDKDPALEALLDNKFEDTGYALQISYDMYERLYVHSHNRSNAVRPQLSPIILGYMRLHRAKKAQKKIKSPLEMHTLDYFAEMPHNIY
jgi:hypothetical protein